MDAVSYAKFEGGGSHALLRRRAGAGRGVLIKGGRRRFRLKTGGDRETERHSSARTQALVRQIIRASSTRRQEAARSEDGSRKTSSAVAVARTPASREEAAVAALSDRVYAATGITLKPGYEVRGSASTAGGVQAATAPRGRYSSPGELIAALKKQHEKEQARASASGAPRGRDGSRGGQRRAGEGGADAVSNPRAIASAAAAGNLIRALRRRRADPRSSPRSKPTKALAASKSSSSSLAAATPALPWRVKRARLRLCARNDVGGEVVAGAGSTIGFGKNSALNSTRVGAW